MCMSLTFDFCVHQMCSPVASRAFFDVVPLPADKKKYITYDVSSDLYCPSEPRLALKPLAFSL